jgi:hypothetical protein
MEQNTPEKIIHNPDRWDRARLDRELEFDVLEEIPEISSVGRFDRFQFILFPLLALILISILPLALVFTTGRHPETGISRDFPFENLENPILRSAVEELNYKRREVDLKDVQIRQYQNRVLDMDNRLQLLEDLTRDRLQLKEQDLLAEISSILSEKRLQLEKEGKTEDQIDKSLSEIKAGLESSYNEKLDTFRDQEMDVYRQRLESLQEERNSLKEALDSAVEERKNLALTLKTDESELLNQLYGESDFINIVNAGVDTDLEILKETRNVENYWFNELSNQYIGMMDAISLRDYEKAERHLTALENLFSDTETASFPGISARNEADRELIRFFSAYLSSLKDNNLEKFITESEFLIDQALSNMNEGRYQEAEVSWRQLALVWPLMEKAISGYLETSRELAAGDIRRFARLSRSSVSEKDYESAEAIWESGLDQIPDPVGSELRIFWDFWNGITEKRLDEKDQMMLAVLADEKDENAERIEQLRRNITAAADADRRILSNEIDSLQMENQTLRGRVETLQSEKNEIEAELVIAETAADKLTEMVPREQLEETEEYLTELELEISSLKTRLAELEAAANETEAAEAAARERKVETPSAQWHLYGIIKEIRSNTFIVEALKNEIAHSGTEVRIMKSLGDNRVLHVADGIIIEASQNRTVVRLSTVSNGVESYGSPEVDDLVYIETVSGSSADNPPEGSNY